MYRYFYTSSLVYDTFWDMGHKEVFSIRQMIELTGLSEFTIRGWENRYSAFEPSRSDTGRREYSKQDVERALLLRELLKRGYKIGQIAKLSSQKLLGLFENSDHGSVAVGGPPQVKWVKDIFDLMSLQKWAELSQLLKEVDYKDKSKMVHDFFVPLLVELSKRVSKGDVAIAQEHVFSAFIKERIYAALSEVEISDDYKRHRAGVRFVLAAPEGDHHEIGLLLAHLLIRAHGFMTLYLGPHTPAHDLVETALRFEASHLLVVATIAQKQGARLNLFKFVSEVQKRVGHSMSLILAGAQAACFQNDPRSSVLSFSDFHNFEIFLQSLKVGRRGAK